MITAKTLDRRIDRLLALSQLPRGHSEARPGGVEHPCGQRSRCRGEARRARRISTRAVPSTFRCGFRSSSVHTRPLAILNAEFASLLRPGRAGDDELHHLRYPKQADAGLIDPPDPSAGETYCFAGDTFFGRYMLKLLSRAEVAERLRKELQTRLAGCPLIVNLEGVVVGNARQARAAHLGDAQRCRLGLAHVIECRCGERRQQPCERPWAGRFRPDGGDAWAGGPRSYAMATLQIFAFSASSPSPTSITMRSRPKAVSVKRTSRASGVPTLSPRLSLPPLGKRI